MRTTEDIILKHFQAFPWKHLLRVIVFVVVLSKKHGMDFMKLFAIVRERSKLLKFRKMTEASETRIVT